MKLSTRKLSVYVKLRIRRNLLNVTQSQFDVIQPRVNHTDTVKNGVKLHRKIVTRLPFDRRQTTREKNTNTLFASVTSTLTR